VQVNIKNLIDDVPCYQTVRELRWPDGIACPSCQSKQVIKRGFDDTELARQRYECHDCHTRFDDLTDTIFAGHHQPLKVWILCLYFMGLNLSNKAVETEAFKKDNRRKLSVAAGSEKHLFVYIERTKHVLWVAVREETPPTAGPTLPPEMTHIWVTTWAGDSAWHTVWRAQRGSLWTHMGQVNIQTGEVR
jgi:transposase-like protein